MSSGYVYIESSDVGHERAITLQNNSEYWGTQVGSPSLVEVKGLLTLQTIFVSYSYNGEDRGAINIQASDYNITLYSTEEEVKDVALDKITKLLAEQGTAI